MVDHILAAAWAGRPIDPDFLKIVRDWDTAVVGAAFLGALAHGHVDIARSISDRMTSRQTILLAQRPVSLDTQELRYAGWTGVDVPHCREKDLVAFVGHIDQPQCTSGVMMMAVGAHKKSVCQAILARVADRSWTGAEVLSYYMHSRRPQDALDILEVGRVAEEISNTFDFVHNLIICSHCVADGNDIMVWGTLAQLARVLTHDAASPGPNDTPRMKLVYAVVAAVVRGRDKSGALLEALVPHLTRPEIDLVRELPSSVPEATTEYHAPSLIRAMALLDAADDKLAMTEAIGCPAERGAVALRM